jgi:hypothetical protein
VAKPRPSSRTPQKLSSIVANYPTTSTFSRTFSKTFVDRGQLRQLSQPTILCNGKRPEGRSSSATGLDAPALKKFEAELSNQARKSFSSCWIA